ncbi:MAG: response regulator [Chitinophagales bacterium]|nr:response regulator [Chitinophagales bacterium]
MVQIDKLIILIVDDNIDFVNRIVNMIEDLDNIGYINVAADYDEALKCLEERPDLVLLDINLPGKSGLDLLRWIKGSDLNPKIIMISNHGDEYYRKACYDLGADYFLDKSNEFLQVSDIIRNISNHNYDQ